MKAARLTVQDDSRNLLTVNDAPKPLAGEGQVLVAVHAAAANPFDWKVRDGLIEGAPLTLPGTLGGDVAGVVAEIGPGVSGFEVGQPVFGQANAVSGEGSFAEFTPVRANSLATKPSSIDFNQAAALPLTASSAYQALVEHAKLQRGQKILVHGAAGGIGTIAVQLAKHLGAYVAATASAADAEYVKNLGAAEVIDYQNQDFSTILKGYDVVYDTVGGDTFTKSFEVLKPGGVLVTMTAQKDDVLASHHEVTAINQLSKVSTEKLQALAQLVDLGVLKVNIDKVFPLDQAAEAVEYLKTGHPRGKVVIQVK